MAARSPGPAAPLRVLLDAAIGGDEAAFRRLVEPHHRSLHAHCYRMLGSIHDAEDVLQEVLLRTWRSLHRFEPDRPLRPWLYAIATNACLDAIARRSKRRLHLAPDPATTTASEDEPWLPPPVWLEPYPDAQVGADGGYAGPEARYEQREALELAFIVALQHLPARQRAVLILRDVLEFSAREVAEALGTTVPAVNSALQRARRTISGTLPRPSQQATLRSLGSEQVRAVIERFVDACQAGDVGAILALLAEDVTFAMPPHPGWWRGRDAVAESWLIPSGPEPGLRYVPAHANGQLALGAYLLDEEHARYLPVALDVLTLRGTSITSVTAFRTPELFPSFGLPSEISATFPSGTLERDIAAGRPEQVSREEALARVTQR